MGAVKRAIQTLKNLIFANLENWIGSTENVNQALRVMRFTIHTGLKVRPFEQHGRKARTESNNKIIDNESYLSDWKTMNVSVSPKQISIQVVRNEKDVTDYIIMAREKKIRCCSSHKSPKRKPISLVSENLHYPYTF